MKFKFQKKKKKSSTLEPGFTKELSAFLNPKLTYLFVPNKKKGLYPCESRLKVPIPHIYGIIRHIL
jgi:hypothetical protein